MGTPGCLYILLLSLLFFTTAWAAPGPKLTQIAKQGGTQVQLLHVDPSGARIGYRLGPSGQEWTFSLTERVVRKGGADGILPVQPAPKAIHPTKAGRVVVAELPDGTLRWYTADGTTELAAFFPHRDEKRWIAWTPSGYYDASVLGEELLGFHVALGDDLPEDLFHVGQMREQLHRPAVLGRVLFTLDERRALEEVDAEAGRASDPGGLHFPSVLRLISPVEGATVQTEEVTLCVAIRSSAPEKEQLVATLLGPKQMRGIVVSAPNTATCLANKGESTKTLHLRIPQEDSTVRIVAKGPKTTSAPVLLHLRWAGSKKSLAPSRPTLHVLAVGVGAYKRSSLSLRFAAKDAIDLGAMLQGLRDRPYAQIEQRILTDSAAVQTEVLAGFAWLKERAKETDISIVFFAGHGINDDAGRYYFLPHDAAPEAADPQQNASLLSGDRLREALSQVPGRLVLFLDTCHAGSLRGPTRGDLSRFRNELLSSGADLVLYAASGPGQASQEAGKWNNGAFTKALLEGLEGKADYREQGVVTVTALEAYLAERVSSLTSGDQIPTTTKVTATDFVLSRPGRTLALHRRWWFWVPVGLVVAGAVTGVAVGTYRPTVSF